MIAMRQFDQYTHVNELADAFAEQHFSEDRVKQWVRSCGIPRGLLDSFLDSELGDYCRPANLGGKQCSFAERAALLARLTRRAGATLPFLTEMLTMALLSTMRLQSQEEIEADFLLDSDSRHISFSQAFSEDGAGTDATAVRTTVTVEDGAIYLDGDKTFVSGGQFAQRVLVLARDPVFGQVDGGLSLWLVPISEPGVFTYPLKTVGQEMLAPAVLRFDHVKLNPDWQIQSEGRLSYMLKRQYNLGRILISASSLGLARAAMDDALRHASTRMTKGQLLGSLPQIQEKLTDMEVKLRAMEMLVYDACIEVDTKERGYLACALMKRYVPNASTEVASEALQMLGGVGYTDNARVGRIWCDCRGNQIAQGTDEIMVRYAAKLLIEER